eukprot:469810-Prymnesium_polylepis.1
MAPCARARRALGSIPRKHARSELSQSRKMLSDCRIKTEYAYHLEPIVSERGPPTTMVPSKPHIEVGP